MVTLVSQVTGDYCVHNNSSTQGAWAYTATIDVCLKEDLIS